jgi:hypothetical protein
MLLAPLISTDAWIECVETKKTASLLARTPSIPIYKSFQERFITLNRYYYENITNKEPNDT